ncbi:hypothetical protein V6N12_073614 [Hibiscus sabdariffa]|uniref:GAG-pre-integrase domain-containing protein n=1 Tax=Hibiscus sabdariffa TaxID=183260 RepID=A0ABR2AGK9_9ROSI
MRKLVNLAYDETSWVIDTCSSIHAMSRMDFFISYTPGDFGVLKMGNDVLVSVTGTRNVRLVSNNGTKLILKDVRHAPNICLNLISAGKLDDEGFCNIFSDGPWKLTKGSLVVARGKKSSNLYLMQALTSRDTVNVAVNDSSTELWHKRLSHMRKQRSVSFRSCPSDRRSKLLELTHSDVCGPVKDKRSKLDAKTRQCIFIGYGLDGEFGYRIYDPVQKKLMRSQDVVFIEDHTIDDIDKTEKEDSPNSGDVTDVNPVPLNPSPNPIQDDIHGDVNDYQQDIDRQSSIRYSSDDYVLLIDEGEPGFYEKAMESECKISGLKR